MFILRGENQCSEYFLGRIQAMRASQFQFPPASCRPIASATADPSAIALATADSLRRCDVEAGGVVGGVGVVELHQAVGVGRRAAQVQPRLQVRAGLDVEALPGRPLRLQQHRAVRAPLQDDGSAIEKTEGSSVLSVDTTPYWVTPALICHSRWQMGSEVPNSCDHFLFTRQWPTPKATPLMSRSDSVFGSGVTVFVEKVMSSSSMKFGP